MSPTAPRDPPDPFLKWAGGKRQLLPRILIRIQRPIGTYFEPFLGGGAVFFALAKQKAFRRARLSDRNRDLIDAYLGVRDHLGEICRLLAAMPYDRDFYYRERGKDPATLSLAERTARIIYLNRICFNGLYRVNSKGRFNVPFGRYKNPRILDAENLAAVSASLQGVSIEVADFAEALAGAGQDDFVYFDPPYYPISETANFTAYDACPFGEAEQERLAALMHGLTRRRVKALLSNSDISATRRLYSGLRLDTVEARRPINSRADRRGPVSELLVRNY